MMTNDEYEDYLGALEETLLEDLRDERRRDPHIKVPTKAQQKKIIKLAHAKHPNGLPDELYEEFEEAWKQVQKEAEIAARKRAAKKAAKLGTPPPLPEKKDPHKARTHGWRKCFLKKDPGSDGGGHYAVLQPYFKTPTNDQVLTVIQALDRDNPSWDSKIRQSEKQSNKATTLFANKFAQMFPEMAKKGKTAKPKGKGCLILLVPLIGTIYFVCYHFVRVA
ncbi:hypothetical protein OAH64_00675 [bacterium]|nr:hypothetical protein [bacterium]